MFSNCFQILNPMFSLNNGILSHRHLNTSDTGGKKKPRGYFYPLTTGASISIHQVCWHHYFLKIYWHWSKVTPTVQICQIFAAEHHHINHPSIFYQMVLTPPPQCPPSKRTRWIQRPFLMRCSWKRFLVTSLQPVPGPQMNLPQCEHVEKLGGLKEKKKKKEIRTSERCITLGG